MKHKKMENKLLIQFSRWEGKRTSKLCGYARFFIFYNKKLNDLVQSKKSRNRVYCVHFYRNRN